MVRAARIAEGNREHTTEVDDTTLTPNDNQIQFDKAGHTIGMDGESFYGSATNVIVNRIARDWDFNFSCKQQSPTYRADNGFQRALLKSLNT